MNAAVAQEPGEPTKLGTFGGVFTPSILTILGLVLFLRLGFVTGTVGLGQMLLILALATSVSVLTTISLAAIATNLRVGGGGVYFLISRTLGPAFGGAIGLVLFVAMSVSVAFYAIGLGEAVASAIGNDNAAMPQLIAAVTIVGLLGLAWLGADIATRLQYVVMACLVVAIAAYFIGVADQLEPGRISENFTAEVSGNFWFGFAIFFPAITGFTQGVAMSGDLKTPSESISRGTFGAIGVSTVVYLLVIFTFVMAVPLTELESDTAIMRRLSLTPWLVDVGVIAATLSSAISSIMGAPRTLQRLAADRLVKPLEPFAVGAGPSDNPRRGTALSAAIALVTVALGDLDVVAPVISMFFLASYGMINYATYSEARAASTSFRPRFRLFDWRLSLLGTVACLGAILAIDPLAGALAGIAVFALFRYLRTTNDRVRWADSTRGFHASEVRKHLRSMGSDSQPGRDYRPCTIAFVSRDPARRQRLAEVATWLEGSAGFTTVARIIPGTGPMLRKKAAQIEVELQRELEERRGESSNGDVVYGRVLVAPSREDGVASMLQVHGIGALRPNLALFGAHDPAAAPPEVGGQHTDATAALVRSSIRHGCNAAVVHAPAADFDRVTGVSHDDRSIAVWWTDDDTGKFLTMLAFLCTRARVWQGARIDVWLAAEHGTDEDLARIGVLLDEARLPAKMAGRIPASEMATAVRPADLLFAPLRVRQGKALGPGDRALGELLPDLGLTVFAQAVASVELDLQPDDSGQAAILEAKDRAVARQQRADVLSEEAGTLMVQAELLRLSAGTDDVDPAAIAAADEAAAAANRRYVDALTRADEAWRHVRELDPTAVSESLDPSLWVGSATRRRRS